MVKIMVLVFDGDEMNLHAPQSVEAATELREIAAVPLQIISPRESVPIVSVVQDTLVGANRFTRPNVLFNKKETMNLLVHAKRWNGKLPEPAVMDPQPMWSGQQLISTLFPPVNLEMPNSSYSDEDKKNPVSQNFVRIQNGILKQGIIDKSVFSKQLLQIMYNDYGPDMTVDFLDSLQAMIAAFLMNSGFSVGISDLIADDATNVEIQEALKKLSKTIEDQILQLHTGLFENSSGRSNQEEFEAKLMGTLNKAVGDAGKIGLRSLADTNRMTNMIKAGSKGSDVNVSQMVATLGQQAIEGKRVPNGFQHRTLPHFKRFDDSAQARGFIASSYIKGLQPDEFFFHAMSGREGLIDTAVKSVTAETPIVVLENGVSKRVEIGPWIDAQLDAAKDRVEHFEERDMELLNVDNPIYIPTADADGNVSWGAITAITRHDPGKELYEIKTAAGKSVIVTESKSLLIYDAETKKFERMSTPDVRPGHYVPVTMNMPAPPTIISCIDLASYLPKTEYLYGTEFAKACDTMHAAMTERSRIPSGWWSAHNGVTFTLPYSSKAKLQRATVRSNMSNIAPGYVYPFTTNREHSRIPEKLELNYENGVFLGLYIAEGNSDISSGYVQISNNNPAIRSFVAKWFESMDVTSKESTKVNAVGGVSTDVRGYSTLLAKLLTDLVGHGAENKRVPAEAFAASNEFVCGLLNGYISGDGTVSENSIEAGSASKELIDGISMLCTRIGVFGKVFMTQLKSNNVGTVDIAPTYRIAIRAQWARKFADTMTLVDDNKEKRLRAIAPSASHRNFNHQNDVVLDEILEIKTVDVAKYPKVYDLTVPSTLNFGLANGLHVVDTADTGYLQRQIRVALEDLITQHDGSVRDATGNILQLSYGEDGINATKLESQPLPIAKLTDEDIRAEYAADGASNAEEYIKQATEDRRILVEHVFLSKPQNNVRHPVYLDRVIKSVAQSFVLKPDTATVTATEVLEAQTKILQRTHAYNHVWGALIRWHMRPVNLMRFGYTRAALDALAEQIVIKHWGSWVEPGQPVGVIAAQSIGEPATQMTLNSVDWHTEIIIAKDGEVIIPRIGEFIDDYIKSCPEEKIQHLPNEQLYVPLDDGHDWKAISCDENGTMMWTKLEAITKHPVINADGSSTILEVETESGRTVRATKARSFLVYKNGKLEETNGSDLKIGDQLPIANDLVIPEKMMKTMLEVKTVLSPTEWLYGDEAAKALAAMEKADAEGNRHWFSHANGRDFTVPYRRSDSFRDAFAKGHNTRAAEFKPGFVYPKSTRSCTSNIPSEIPLTREFGYLCGAYLSEGSTSDTQIQITNNDDAFLAPIRAFLDTWSVGHHTVSSARHAKKTGIKGRTTSLVIHSTLLTSLFRSVFGRMSYEKTMPGWVLQASDEFLKGLVDAYFSGDGCVGKSNITFGSTSDSLVTRMMSILARYGIFSTRGSHTPALRKFDSVHTIHNVNIGVQDSLLFAKTFTLTIKYKQDRLDHLLTRRTIQRKTKYEQFEDTKLDKVTSIREVDPWGGRVYDVTVEETRNFTVGNLLVSKDTFHLAGVAAKSNMTRGVPRIKELLKATRNPKAIELQIPLRRDLRDKKEEARRVAQDLEFTLLQDIVTVSRIYYDPRDSSTLIAEDTDWLAFMSAYETMTAGPKSASALPDPMAAGGAGAVAPVPEDAAHPWILRFELDRERMFAKNITMDDIALILQTKYGAQMQFLYTDYNAPRLVIRARYANDYQGSDSALIGMKVMQNRILSTSVVRGIPGLRAVNYQKVSDVFEYKDGKYQPVDQYMLISDGSNFLDVLTHPDVDPMRIVSSNIHDMMENLGIEATRATLFKEITTLFTESGTGVNYRHISVLIDKMCHKGRVMSVDRYGINKNDIGPLAKMSFEQTAEIAMNAAEFGERDPCLGISAKVMLGAPIKAGTGFSELLFDESSAIKLASTTPDQHPAPARGPAGYTGDEIEDVLYGEADDDECAVENIHMHVAMPAAPEDDIPEDIDDEVEISIVA